MKRMRTLILSACIVSLPGCWSVKEMDFQSSPGTTDDSAEDDTSSLWGDWMEEQLAAEDDVDRPPMQSADAGQGLPKVPIAIDDRDGDPIREPATLHVLLTDAPGDFESVPVTISGVEAFLAEEASAAAEDDFGLAGPGSFDAGAFDPDAGHAASEEPFFGFDAGAPRSDSGGEPVFADGGAGFEGRWVTLVDESHSHDLLELQNGVTAALGDALVPAGRYTQIRLIVDSAAVVVDGQTHDLRVPSGDQTGLKLNYDFDMRGDGAYELVLDFDAQASIKKAGPKYLLTPVIKVQSFADVGAD